MCSHLLLSSTLLPFFLLTTTWAPLLVFAAGGKLTLDMHHRYSDKARRWAESMSLNTTGWPEIGGVEYYAALVEHDRAFLHRRGLVGGNDGNGTLTFSGGNQTTRVNELGFLHYVEVDLGTPRKTFFVALDTGSDLFWVPCDCQDCTPTSWLENHAFDIYNSSSSSTNKKLTCQSTLCELQLSCTSPSDPCPYRVRYLSGNMSTSGVLMEDILHLTTEDTQAKAVEANITFGCGKVQSSGFLEGPASNGLFGLGLGKISVPSTLSDAGLIANSFSMCFGLRGPYGRISFGDKGSTDQQETSLITTESVHKLYIVVVTGTQVGNATITEEFFALPDTGTSFTILADPGYTKIAEAFNSQVEDERFLTRTGLPFDYCYLTNQSSRSTRILINIPEVLLTMKGGSKFTISSPVVAFAYQEKVLYCLGVIKSENVNIIGQNFMKGLRVVFDRERLIFGWKEFDCYNNENSPIPWTNKGNISSPNPTPSGSYSPQPSVWGNNDPGHDRARPPGNSAPLGHSMIWSLNMILSLLCFFMSYKMHL